MHRWERALVILGVCLPIPVFAATGLSVPLPTTVERMAAALVPWAGEAELDGQPFSLGEDGSIVLAAGEVSPTVIPGYGTAPFGADPRIQLDGGHSERRRHPDGSATGRSRGKPTPANGGTSTAPGGGSDVGGGSGSGGGGSGGSLDPSAPETGPLQGAVGGVVGATDPVVGAVEGATGGTGVGGVVEGVGGAVEDTAGTADGIVTGLGG